MKLSLSANISKLRKEHAMTQEQLAEKLMVSVDSVSNYENGRTTCMHDHLIHMSELFNIPVDYFFGGKIVTSDNNSNLNKIMELLNCLDDDKCEKIYRITNILYGDKL